MKIFNKDDKWYFIPLKGSDTELHYCDEADELMDCSGIDYENCIYNLGITREFTKKK